LFGRRQRKKRFLICGVGGKGELERRMTIKLRKRRYVLAVAGRRQENYSGRTKKRREKKRKRVALRGEASYSP